MHDGSMSTSPLRCHLLIGPPGSGKTTLANQLAPMLQGADGGPCLVLSTDVIRAELFGDAAVQGPWDEIRTVLLQRLQSAVAAGRPVIIDATHARRPWRLMYTQGLQLPQPVEWIGWWLTTTREQCKAWALRRDRPVPESVIEEFHASLDNRFFRPDRAEGFATIVTLNPGAGEGSDDDLRGRLVALDGRIRNALNRQRAVTPQLHRYSRLLDLERLLFLLRLLTSFNGLDDSDPGTAAELLKICNPPPQGDVAERAAAYLGSWNEVHGGNSECYADATAIRADLAWLEANGFTGLDWQSDQPIEAGSGGPPEGSSVNGGQPALASQEVFRRVFTLLRHVLKYPFDAPEASSDREQSEPEPSAPPSPRPKRAKRASTEFGPFYRHLIDNLQEIEGSYRPDQEAALRYDIEHVLTPYGFLPTVKGKGRPHSRRQGYAIGTALLSADQLLQVHAQLKASHDRLSDQSQKPLLLTLEERLQRAGILGADGNPDRLRQPRRALAHRSYTEEKPGTLSSLELSPRVERAIRDRRRVWLRHTPDVVDQEQRKRGDDGSFRAWPLQLIFHNISWYLAFETSPIGRSDGLGLIRVLRLDRLVLTKEDGNVRRSSEQEHAHALERLERLMDVCGGVYFGESIEDQLAVMGPLLCRSVKPPYQVLRFSCTPWVFILIKETPRRYPLEHIAFSRAIQGDDSKDPNTRCILTPNPAGDSHPYPVEFRLPDWTIEHDWDLHNWLFRWGAGIRIEQPIALRQKQLQQAQEVVDLYGQMP
ncbi:WYL domain-containing protein [Cyanobium sp. WKJ7-Wakatipu]|nr:WYL domain-containing protein [Cyanobium sp. WKJ7-Wakatipu]